MRSLIKLSVPFLACAVLTFTACSDDNPTPTDTGVGGTNPDATVVTNPDAAVVTNPDAAPNNPDAAEGTDATVEDTGIHADAAAAVDSGAPDSGEPDAGAAGPVWADVYRGVIAPNCSCHTNGGGSGGLSFPNARADIADVRTALERVANANCTGGPFDRVTPGNPAQSALFLKITSAGCGSRMPLGGGALPAASTDLVRDWITAGAN